MKIMSILLIIAVFIFPRIITAQSAEAEIERRHLRDRYNIEYVEPTVLKMTHKLTGFVRYFDIRERQVDFNTLFDDVQVIDLINADTSLYNHLYTYQSTIPVAGTAGYPLIIGDFNHNNRLDFAGVHFTVNDTGTIDAAIAEMDDDTTFTLRKRYDFQEIPIPPTDLNNDGLLELNFKKGKWMNNLISSSPDSFPDSLNTSYCMWEVIGGGIGHEHFLDLDKDGNLDLLYRGADTLPPWGTKLFVAEYDSLTNLFVKKFSIRPSTFSVSNFSIDDFDNDSFTEFAMGSIFGDVFVIENTGNDSYALNFTDTISVGNAYLSTRTNDIDGNGKPEFFIGGTGYYNGIGASRIYWFEADGNNNYQKVRSFYLLGANILGLYRLYDCDVNADGIDDLVFSYEYFVVILIWNPNGYFDLFFYLNGFDLPHRSIQSINIYDIFNTGHPNLLINFIDVTSQNYKYKTFFYRNNFLSSIAHPLPSYPKTFTLHQNYPNPFNSTTLIRFDLSKRALINLTIYDITGKEVVRLIKNQVYAPGLYQIIWKGINQNGKEVSSGIYLYELTAEKFKQVKKMLLIK
jgi:hypothetical protein